MTDIIVGTEIVHDDRTFARCTGFYHGIPSWMIYRGHADTALITCSEAEVRERMANPSSYEQRRDAYVNVLRPYAIHCRENGDGGSRTWNRRR